MHSSPPFQCLLSRSAEEVEVLRSRVEQLEVQVEEGKREAEERIKKNSQKMQVVGEDMEEE